MYIPIPLFGDTAATIFLVILFAVLGLALLVWLARTVWEGVSWLRAHFFR